jgi:nucleoside-diphosphate-sugar epimerase
MNSSEKKVAILGATSHIAKGLIYEFLKLGTVKLFLFARSIDRVTVFLKSIVAKGNFILKDFKEFELNQYDVIINCVGLGDPAKLRDNIVSIFRLTETFDNLVIVYLEKHPETLYINFSSGAAYGSDFSMPVDESTQSRWDINNITEADYYGIAKFSSEAKHRALKHLNIADLRIFSYFSRFINLESKFLMCEIISCIQKGREFVTGADDIIRDYVHPEDLMSLIQKCIEKTTVNETFDAYSLSPVRKFEILDYFTNTYGLQYITKGDIQTAALTGPKSCYYSNNRRAERIGYNPRFTALGGIMHESARISLLAAKAL